MLDPVRERAEIEVASLARKPIKWTPSVRVIPVFDPIPQLETLDPALQAAALAEVATVAPQLLGRVELLPPGPMPAGPGASALITAFTFSRPNRFNGNEVAAFYGGNELSTAIAETVHHLTAHLRGMRAPPQTMLRVAMHVDVISDNVLDARASAYAAIYDPNSYVQSRVFGDVARRNHDGILYRSVRRHGGECVAVYAISALSNGREDRRLEYRFNGRTIVVAEIHYP